MTKEESPDCETVAILRAFGLQIRRTREALGISQAEVGRRAGLPQTYVSKIELGEKNLSFDTAKRIGDAVGADWRILLLPSGFTAGTLGQVAAAALSAVTQVISGKEDQPITMELISEITDTLNRNVKKIAKP